MSRQHTLVLVRVVSGGVFVVFGLGKFVNHGAELGSFKSYGLPAPELFVVAIGVIELVGGVLLIAGWLVRPTALVLAGDMIGAILASGLPKGEIISLTLAPAQLVAMIILLWPGALTGSREETSDIQRKLPPTPSRGASGRPGRR